MNETYLRGLRISTFIMMFAALMMTRASAQTQSGALDVGVELGPFIFIATGGHETIGGFALCGEPQIGYFLSDELAIGASGFFYRPLESSGPSPSTSFGGAYGYANYHFNSGGTWSPYIGGRLGVFKPNLEMQFAFGVQTGLMYFVTREFSVNAQLEIQASSGSYGDIFLSSLGLGLSYCIK